MEGAEDGAFVLCEVYPLAVTAALARSLAASAQCLSSPYELRIRNPEAGKRWEALMFLWVCSDLCLVLFP